MAGIGAESTLGAIAAIAGLDKVSIERLWRDQAVEDQTKKLTNLLQQYRDNDLITQADYEKTLAAIRPKAEALAADDVKRLTTQLDTAAQNDPIGTYERIRSGNLASLTGIGSGIKDWSTAQGKMSQQRFAGGNTGDGTGGLYGDRARTNQITRDMLPLANTIYGNLGRDTNILGSEQSRGLADYVNLLRERSAIPFRNAYTTLLPQQNRYNTLGQQIGALGGLENISRANYLGTQATENKWGRALKGLGRGLDETVNTAADIGTSLFSSYMGGQGGTNLSGAQRPQQQQGFTPAQQQPFGSQQQQTQVSWDINPTDFQRQQSYYQPPPYNSGYDYTPPSRIPSNDIPERAVPYDAYFTGYA